MEPQANFPAETPEEPAQEALRRAIELCGSMTALANLFEPPLRPQAVQQWRRVPPERVIDVSRATGYRVTPHELRPDLYPHPDDGLPHALRRGMGGSSIGMHP